MPINRELLLRLVIIPIRFLIVAWWVFSLAISEAHATYAVGFIGDGYVIIGTDSRMLGYGANDSVCKVFVSNRTGIAAALIGANSFIWSDGARVDVFKLVSSAAEQAKNAYDAANIFNRTFLNKLNEADYDFRKTIYPLFINGVNAMFADVTDGNGRVVFTDVYIHRDFLTFFARSPRVHDGIGHLVPISDFGGQSIKFADGLFYEGRSAIDHAFNVKTLIQMVISANLADNIGGVPTVVLLSNGSGPQWISKADGCKSAE